MNHALVEKVAQAVLYEGYILYPYRPSVKNSHRWTFGGLYPEAYSESQKNGDASSLLTECIVLGNDATTLEVKVRFLHLIDRQVGKLANPATEWPADRTPEIEFVDCVAIGEKKYQRWQEAMERAVVVPAVALADLITQPLRQEFSFSASTAREKIRAANGQIAVVLVREQQEIAGDVELAAESIGGGVFKISVRVSNRTPINVGSALRTNSHDRQLAHDRAEDSDVARVSNPCSGPQSRVENPCHDKAPLNPDTSLANSNHEAISEQRGMGALPMSFGYTDTGGPPVPRSQSRDQALLHALVSTHAILGVANGQFVSMTDPPADVKDAVDSCKNIGVWPVLVGEVGATDAILASPIILYDYPQIAPESPGDLFDGGEIDEILSLRIMTLTDEEKRDVSSIDARADAMLKRTESLAREQLMNLHGGMNNVDRYPVADDLPPWDPMADRPKLPSVRSDGVDLRPGDRVRLRPTGGADAFDMMLDGMIATIAVIEQDYEDRVHLAVTIDDDPGADFGVAGKPGHRFFFRPEEVEPVERQS